MIMLYYSREPVKLNMEMLQNRYYDDLNEYFKLAWI
jgi:hypothetical protein